jgi:hypothetical protein
MNGMVKVVENNLSQIRNQCKRHKLKSLYQFESTADPNYFNHNSDVDFLNEYNLENYPDWDKGDFGIATNISKMLIY